MKSTRKAFFILLIAAVFAIVACNSRGTDETADSGFGTIFVGDSPNTGTITINLGSITITVAETGTFSVTIRDVNGAPVPNAEIICDTENDLKLIEPLTGLFITDSFGSASGVLGCGDQGSFRIGCRLTGGGNARDFASVKCEGERPIGFDGFADAGGGTLGNGVFDVNTDDADDDSEFTVRVISTSFVELGSLTTAIDLSQITDCDPDADGLQVEPFSDTLVQFTVSNNTSQIARITSYSYTIANFDGTGASYSSPTINLVGEALAEGATGTFQGLFLDAEAGGKEPFGLGAPITATGFKNVTFRLFGSLSDGTPITVSVANAGSFDHFNNC